MVDQPSQRMIMRGGMMLPEEMVRSNTPMIPTRQQENQVISKTTGVQPLSQRMSAAYDRMKSNENTSKKITSKDTVAIGKLVLEIEQVKNNLNSIENEFRSTFRKKAELDAKENELLEEETERLTALGAGFRKFRRTLGGIAAALSGKQFLEGDVQGGLQNAGIAVTAFLPEIIKVVSTVVLGKMLLSGRGMGAASGVTRGGGRGGLLPLLLGGGGLLAAGTALGSRGGGDQRRLELTKRQAIPQLLSRNDVRRFRSSTTRFDNILTGMTGSSDLAFNKTTPLEVGEDIEEPKGFVEVAKGLGGDIANFFKDEDTDTDEDDSNDVDGIEPNKGFFNFSLDDFDKQIESEFIEIFGQRPQDISLINQSIADPARNEDTLSMNLPTAEKGGSNIISLGSENKQISNNAIDIPKTSNVSVKSTFSDNSKISYILEYGAGVVI